LELTGHKIRNDSPLILKRIIEHTKEKLEGSTLKANFSAKISYIIELLNCIKLNKIIKNDPTERLSFLKNWLKNQVMIKLKLKQITFPLTFE